MMKSSNRYPQSEVLMRYGIDRARAKSNATNELINWNIEEIASVFKKIQRPSFDFAYFRDLPTRPASAWEGWWPSIYRNPPTYFISPPHVLMQRAVDEDAALCINAQGQWSLRKSGYLAFSHVWVEGLQRDDTHNGVDRRKVLAMFDLVRSRELQTEWLWADVLAIPGGGGPTSSVEDEILKINVINTLPQVYSRAEAVLIIDALVLQLQETDLTEVAMALTCGKWITRVWTYQEIKLAHRALILTGKSAHEFTNLVKHLEIRVEENHAKYYKLYHGLRVLQRHDELGISIPDIIMACHSRTSGQDIDYARAFFPTLGLEWEYGMSREEGMQKIYLSQPRHASRVLFFYGAPRMKLRPAWASTYLNGLEGVVTESMEWQERGIFGELYAVKILTVVKTFRNARRFVFNFEVDSASKCEMQCSLAISESEAAAKAFESAATQGECYVLSPTSSIESIDSEWARVALLVQKQPVREFEGLEVAAWFTANIHTRHAYEESKTSVLIRHEVPENFDIYGDAALHGQILHFWSTQKEESMPSSLAQQPGETALHAAVRNNLAARVRELLDEGEEITVFNSAGWTPLHIAAARGHVEILNLLLSKKPDIEVNGEKLNKSTPLSHAAEHGQAEAIRVLFEHGANIHARNGSGYSPIMVAANDRHYEAVKMLLRCGANPNDESGWNGSVLLVASDTGNRRLPTLKALIEGGAEPNPPHPHGRSAICNVAEWGNEDELAYLLSVGCKPDIPDWNPYTPLFYAIKGNKRECVRLLLEAGADPNFRLKDDWTPLHFGARQSNWQVLQLLLEHSNRDGLDAQTQGDGYTPLHVAVLAKEMTNIKLLLQAGANRDLQDVNGHTPAEYDTLGVLKMA